MLNVDINVTESNFTDEVKEKAKNILIEYANRFIKDKELSVSIKIIIPDDFSEELTDFQRENNLPIEHTNNSYAVASAKTLKLKRKNKTDYVIFFNKGMFYMIVLGKGFGILHLYHELSHIYYNEIIKNKYKEEIKSFELSNNLIVNSNIFSYVIWEEYFVSRELIPYLFGDVDCYMEILTSHYENMSKDLEEEIAKYRYHADIDVLFNSAKEKVTLLATYMSYSLGMIAGLMANYEDVSKEEFDNKIKERTPKLFDIWNALWSGYNILYDSFPNLNLDNLNTVSEQVIEMYKCFGIYLEINENNRLYVNVPL